MPYNYSRERLDNGLSYSAYRQLINDTLARSAHNETEDKMRPYIIDNVVLMDKYEQTCQLSGSLKVALQAAPATTWLVITEGWCGDAAFNLPVLAALEKAVPDKMNIRIFLRDSNLELIDANLTDGGRSIPIVVVLSKELKELGKWGPRPTGLQPLMHEWKSQGMQLKDLIPKVHQWYDEDNMASVQEELTALIKNYSDAAGENNFTN